MRTLVILASDDIIACSSPPCGSLPSRWAQSEVLQLSAKPFTLALSLNDNAIGLELVKKQGMSD